MKNKIRSIIFLLTLSFALFSTATSALAAGYTWTRASSLGTQNWDSVAVSSTGQYMAVDVQNGDIYTSSNYGATWTDQTSAGKRLWYGIAMSADGSHLIAAVRNGNIYTSDNYGATWTDQTGSGTQAWDDVACNSDCGLMAAESGLSGYIYTSTDYGVTWVAHTSTGQHDWSGLTVSADGSHLAAADGTPGYIYTSSNSGSTWTEQSASGSYDWYMLAASSDGSHIYGVGDNNLLHVSTDYGVNWSTTALPTAVTHATAVAVDQAAQTIIVGGSFAGQLYGSTNSGSTWSVINSASGYWQNLAISANDNYILAGDNTGNLWVGNLTATPPTTSSTQQTSTSPATPDTGYGAPSSNNLIVMSLAIASASALTIASGVLIIFRNRESSTK